MKALFVSAILATGLMTSFGVYAKDTAAAAPAGTPAGSTGLCNDGSYWTGATKKGACKGHKGVKDWYATASAAAVAPAVAPAAAKSVAPAPVAPAAAPAAPANKGFFGFGKKTAPAAAPATPTAVLAAPAATHAAPAAGGGAGQVWVNTDSKVYHCSGSKWYGKTKAGSYMSEAAAKAAGAHPDHGKACS